MTAVAMRCKTVYEAMMEVSTKETSGVEEVITWEQYLSSMMNWTS